MLEGLLLSAAAIATGFVLLNQGAKFITDNATRISGRIGRSRFVVGALLVSTLSALPELLVSGIAAEEGSPDIALGNALASTVVTLAFVIGVSALVRPIKTTREIVLRDAVFLAIVTVVAATLLLAGNLTQFEGVAPRLQGLGPRGASRRERRNAAPGDRHDWDPAAHVPPRRTPLAGRRSDGLRIVSPPGPHARRLANHIPFGGGHPVKLLRHGGVQHPLDPRPLPVISRPRRSGRTSACRRLGRRAVPRTRYRISFPSPGDPVRPTGAGATCSGPARRRATRCLAGANCLVPPGPPGRCPVPAWDSSSAAAPEASSSGTVPRAASSGTAPPCMRLGRPG